MSWRMVLPRSAGILPAVAWASRPRSAKLRNMEKLHSQIYKMALTH